MAEVGIENISKRFGTNLALDDLTLTVGDGEFLVLLGPTGAGKTTTLRLVAGLDSVDSGSVSIDDEDVTRLPPAVRDVAFVFQQYSLYPHYTVYDNLAFPLRSPMRRLPDPEIDKRVKQVAELLRIEDKLGNRATALSGGQMQRVAIGRALVRRPNCYLMDEPLSSLDAKLREDLRVELKRIQQEYGATVLYVTHDQVEALTLADRIGVLEEGRLLQLAPPRDIYAAPASIAVARRLGSPQINLLPASSVPDLAPPRAETVGIRPEDVRLDRGGAGQTATIKQVAHGGAETVVLLETLGQNIHALIQGVNGYTPGMSVGVSFRCDGALGFDADGRQVA